ncbi:unnamed protein product [Adineta steineri]|uniref:Tetratricopeptide repeat protein n=1 Tax=Adineta steineri TaxID=433720 RepID=A0A814WNV7_9BILA|nr:unnamed protein product [Adineta steineri]CAF3855515.1 unnamed protein product [Adineta steineri]
MIGQAFRSEDIERIFKFRRSIIDIHRQLANVAEKYKPKEKKLYRGKKLRPIVLQQLSDNIGELMSVNGFLSTTYKRNLAMEVYAGAGKSRIGHESDKSVLFELSIDKAMDARPFADITSISHFGEGEEEVLFTMGSVWTIDSVKEGDDSLWTVELKHCSELDSKLGQLFKQLPDDNTFIALGDVLRELGQHTKAKEFYRRMLNEPMVPDEIRRSLYYKIAKINIAQGEDTEALKNLHEALNLFPSVETNTAPASSQPLYAHGIISSRLPILYNMGRMYEKTGHYNEALKYFTEAADIKESDPIDRATVEDSIGDRFECNMNVSLIAISSNPYS